MMGIIVCKLSELEVQIPVIMIWAAPMPQHVLKRAIDSFSLPIRLWMICSTQLTSASLDLTHATPK